MKVLVVYDSQYGNAEKIARAIAGAVTPPDEVKIMRASEAGADDLKDVGLLFVGAPTQGGRASRAMQAFLEKIPADSLKNVKAAPFDTRMKTKLVKVFGYAAGRIESNLKGKGAIILSPGLFVVKGATGPLVDGEEQRAAEWARGILQGK